jgi:hypothetical protein
MARIAIFTVVVEIGTALTLLVDPALVVASLLGAPADATVQVVGRCFGIALLALAAAWWPAAASAEIAPPYFRGRLISNVLDCAVPRVSRHRTAWEAYCCGRPSRCTRPSRRCWS